LVGGVEPVLLLVLLVKLVEPVPLELFIGGVLLVLLLLGGVAFVPVTGGVLLVAPVLLTGTDGLVLLATVVTLVLVVALVVLLTVVF